MKLTYRPEIDGLRAIAVGAVILYHAQINILGHQPFKGGFIGVDIFFVISGYLITSIILKELVTTGSFSFKHFYERRVRRILPALLFVMLVSLPFAWMYLLPSSFIDFSKSILFSLGFSSNFYFWSSGKAYSAESEWLKPFLHTWSLSVEEQFYILFPIVFIITFKYFRKYLIYILILGFFISLGLADWGSKNYPSFNFYVLPTRGWELLAGSILAYFEINNGHRSKNRILNLILPFIGLILIGHSVLFFNDEMLHPSFYTLSPIIGVCLIIWFSNKNEIITKILSTKLFVGVGLISYSLYLWHYPIFALSRVVEIFSKDTLIYLLIITIILSIFTYRFIERPTRNKNNSYKFIIKLISFFYLIFFIFFITVSFQKISNFTVDKVKNILDYEYYYSKHLRFQNTYNYNNFDKRKNVLIVGNSIGENFLQIMNMLELNEKVYFYVVSPKKRAKRDLNYQISFLNDFFNTGVSKMNQYKKDFSDHLKKQYDKADLIIFSTAYNWISKNDVILLDKIIPKIKKDNKKIIIVSNFFEMEMKENRLSVYDDYVFKNKKIPIPHEIDLIEKKMFKYINLKEDINNQLKNLAYKYQLFYFDFKKLQCDYYVKKCHSVDEKKNKIYFDFRHLTNEGVNFFASKILKEKTFYNYLLSTLHISPN